MRKIDLNCDFGEDFGVYKLDDISEILTYISSVNIACGFHAGDPTTMRQAVEQAVQHDLKIGAHPGYDDLVGFGRRDVDLSAQEVYDLVLYQIGALSGYTNRHGKKLHHVKPHGALYNRAARSREISEAIAQAVYDFSPDIKLYALANSVTVDVATEMGLDVYQEAFIDRTYEEDGSLTSRKKESSVITCEEGALKQALQIITQRFVRTVNHKELPLKADTLCIHGDNENALQFVQLIHKRLTEMNYTIA